MENIKDLQENQTEVRVITDNAVELRKLETGEEVIEGYAVVFNSESQDLGGFKEVILPDAFRNTDMSDVVALFNHDTNLILGRTPSTLTITVDKIGVRYSIKPPNTSAANDLMTSIRRGDVRGSSFGFSINKDGDVWEKPADKAGLWKRTVNSVRKLFDVSPVVSPAYVTTNTMVAKRSLGIEKDKVEAEDSLEIQKKKDLQDLEETKRSRQIERLNSDRAFFNDFDELERSEKQEKYNIALRKREMSKRHSTIYDNEPIDNE